MAKLIWNTNSLKVIREENDPKFYGVVNAAGESHFLHWLKNLLNAQGFDLVKTRMWKDGHMTSDIKQYLRVRSSAAVKKGAPNIALHNEYWDTRGLEEDWNKGATTIALIRDYFLDIEDTSEWSKSSTKEQ